MRARITDHQKCGGWPKDLIGIAFTLYTVTAVVAVLL